jgi:hypothetical protein
MKAIYDLSRTLVWAAACLSVLVFAAGSETPKPKEEAKGLPPGARPSFELEQQLRNFQGQRSPALGPIELDLERMPNGHFRVRSVDPQGPFGGLVEENEVFESMDQIPRPSRNPPGH